MMAVLRRLTTDHPPSAASVRTPAVIVPCIIGFLILLALFALFFYRWVHQDDTKTFQEIETAVRRRRSSTVVSRLSAIDVEAFRGVLSKAMRSDGSIIRSPSPIREEIDAELQLQTVNLTSSKSERRRSSTGSAARKSSAWSGSSEGDGGSLFKVTTMGSIIAPSHWVRKWNSQKRRQGK